MLVTPQSCSAESASLRICRVWDRSEIRDSQTAAEGEPGSQLALLAGEGPARAIRSLPR